VGPFNQPHQGKLPYETALSDVVGVASVSHLKPDLRAVPDALKNQKEPIQIELSRGMAVPHCCPAWPGDLAPLTHSLKLAQPLINREVGLPAPKSDTLYAGGLLAVAMIAPAYTMIRRFLDKRPFDDI